MTGGEAFTRDFATQPAEKQRYCNANYRQII